MVAKHYFLAAAAAFSLMVPASAGAQQTLGGDSTTPKTTILQPSPETEAEAVVTPSGEAAEAHAEADDHAADESHASTDEAHDHSAAHYVAPKQKWSFDGIFGTYDRAALQRGFQVYKEVCAACHSMSRLAYRNLEDLGYNEAEIKAIAADVMITDGPNDDGEMYERPGRPSDAFKAPYPNVQAAKSVNNGAYPPDLSLVAKSRAGGADYIYAILTGYEEAPANKELLAGQYWNKAMNGNVIAMPPPLMAGQVAYGDNADQSVDQYSRDVAHFLTWAAEPKMEARKKTGVKAFLFLLVFTAVMYAVKRKIWSDIH